VCGADIRALFPRRQDGIAGPLRNPHDLLRRAAERQLLDALGDGWYRITTLGRDVVDALPDDARVAELRGCRRTIVGMRRRARSG
jgi:hypothetical protein